MNTPDELRIVNLPEFHPEQTELFEKRIAAGVCIICANEPPQIPLHRDKERADILTHCVSCSKPEISARKRESKKSTAAVQRAAEKATDRSAAPIDVPALTIVKGGMYE